MLGFGASPLGGVFEAVDEVRALSSRLRRTGGAALLTRPRPGTGRGRCVRARSRTARHQLFRLLTVRELTLPASSVARLIRGQRSFYGDTRAERVLGRALKDIPRSEVRPRCSACLLTPRLNLRASSLCCPPRWVVTAPRTSTSAQPASLQAWRHERGPGAVCFASSLSVRDAGELRAALCGLHRHHPVSRH